MRMWHFKLLPFLPTVHLLGQWHDCCVIAQKWANRELNDILVKRVEMYSGFEFWHYCLMVRRLLEIRGFNINEFELARIKDDISTLILNNSELDIKYIWNYMEFMENNNMFTTGLYNDWHNEEYLKICWWNMYERYLCGGIKETDWQKFCEGGRELV